MPHYILGARAHDYGRGTPQEMFTALAADGWACTQLAFKKAITGVGEYANITPALIEETAAQAQKASLKLSVLGTYVELAAMDETLRRQSVESFISQLPVCSKLGIACMASETTAMHKQPDGTTFAQAQKQLLKSLEEILPHAQAAQVDVALEPVWHHALNTTETVCQMIKDVQSQHLKFIFDPANLMSLEWIDRQDVLFGRAMEAWGDKVMAVHFKGVCYTDNKRTPSPLQQSVVDYGAAFAAMRQLPQQELAVLREEAVPQNAAADQAFMRRFF